MGSQSTDQWSGQLAVIVAAVSMAVGTGNIWRFPRVAAEWGGGAFLIAVTVALVVWAIPLLMCEFYMGSRSRLGNVGAFRDFMGRRYTWAGAFMACVTLGIMCYYAVVTGWCLRYLAGALAGDVQPGIDGQAYWDTFVDDPRRTVAWHAAAVVAVTWVVCRGIRGGLERVLKVCLASLLVILLVLLVRAVTLPGASDGLRYLFVPEWSRLGEARLWLEAFTQVAWSTGAGWGLLMVYAVYVRRGEEVVANASVVAVADVLVGFTAAAIVLATLFAVAPSPTFAQDALAAGNVGMTFIYVVELLATMPGAVVFAPLFFLALTLAAISSLIAMFELGTTNLMNLGLQRRRAALCVGGVAFALGLPSAISVSVLDNQDWVWGVGLLVSGLLTALAITRHGIERARADINAASLLRVGRWWSACIRLVPLVFLAIFGWWVVQAVSGHPGSWWHPLEPFGLGTLLLQWLVLFAVVYALNDTLARRVRSGPMSAHDTTGDGSDGR